MTKLIFFFVLIGCSIAGMPQGSSPEAQRKAAMAEIEKQLNELEKTDPEAAKMAREAMAKASMSSSMDDDEPRQLATKPPAKKPQKIAAIKPTPSSKEQIVSLVAGFQQELLKKLSPDLKKELAGILSGFEGNARAMEEAAVVNWISKSPKGALYFAMEAVRTEPADPMYLNNLGAMLILGGREEFAVPLLQYLQQFFPQSAMVNNNLGQAWLGLGDLDKSKSFLGIALAKDSTHPEANHSMGLIYRFMGNNIKATAHFERVTRVCYRKPVVEELKKRGRTTKDLFKLLRPKWGKPKNYFGELKLESFRVPKLPASLAESNIYFQAHLDFQEFLDREMEKWANQMRSVSGMTYGGTRPEAGPFASIVEEIFLTNLEIEQEKDLAWIEAGDDGRTSFPTPQAPNTPGGQQLVFNYLKEKDHLLFLERNEDSIATAHANTTTEAGYLAWKQKGKEIQIKYCRQQMSLADRFLAEFANNQRIGFDQRLAIFPKLINEAFLYASLSPADPVAKLKAYSLVQVYLVFLKAYSSVTMIASTTANNFKGQGVVQVGCDLEKLLAERLELIASGEANLNCHFKITIPLVIAKVSYDCQKIEIEGGEGIVAGVEYEIKTGNVTIAVGPGVETNVPFISAGAKAQVYVTFDGDGNYSDAGFKAEIAAQVGGLQEMEILGGAEGGGLIMESKGTFQAGFNAGPSLTTEGLGFSKQVF